MTTKVKNIVLICLIGVFIFGFGIWSWVKPADPFSDSERRVLKSFPKLNGETLASGEFMNNFEAYTQDQFPLRDDFRTLKALSSLYIFRRADNNDLYLADGHVSSMTYPLNEAMLEHSAEHINGICSKYLEGHKGNRYLCVIPDKNYFLAEPNGYLSVNYDQLISHMREKTDLTYIDVTSLLSADDYYYTDTHWRQNRITDIAQKLCGEMGVSLQGEYTEHVLDTPFYGVYYGQSALPLTPDTITYLTNDVIDSLEVTIYDSGTPASSTVYNFEKLTSKDAYEFFLSGAVAVMTIENPSAKTDRELIIFRDSFGGSIAPLMAEGYSKITLLDTRYVNSAMLGAFVEFEDQDVLFLYSSVLLNNSLALK